MADLSGLSKGFLSQLETGSRQPGSETLSVLAETFAIAITDLIDGEGDSREIVRLDELARSMSAEDLRRLVAIAGLDVSWRGNGGQSVTKIPPQYVSAFLASVTK